MNPAATSFVLGYHGCDRSVADDVLGGGVTLKPSDNDHDWLGDAVYFWEHNPERAYRFALDVSRRPHNDRQRIVKPAVVGAIIELRRCVNLLDATGIVAVADAYQQLTKGVDATGLPLPKSIGGSDRLRRYLDCAVIRELHRARAEAGDPPIQTLRAAFVEGSPLYPDAGFNARMHIQLCVRDLACVRGYFRPLGEDGRPLTFDEI